MVELVLELRTQVAGGEDHRSADLARDVVDARHGKFGIDGDEGVPAPQTGKEGGNDEGVLLSCHDDGAASHHAVDEYAGDEPRGAPELTVGHLVSASRRIGDGIGTLDRDLFDCGQQGVLGSHYHQPHGVDVFGFSGNQPTHFALRCREDKAIDTALRQACSTAERSLGSRSDVLRALYQERIPAHVRDPHPKQGDAHDRGPWASERPGGQLTRSRQSEP